MKVWITKYALTSGIFSVETDDDCSKNMIVYRRPEANFNEYAHGKDWHTTSEAALARAEEMRAKRIKSLKKSLAEVEKMELKA